jgi:serine/threonine protein kinase
MEISKDGPWLRSVRDLTVLAEVFSDEDDENGNPIFLYSTFGYITDQFTAYFGQSELRKYKLTPEIIMEELRPVPDDDVFPEAPSDITVAAISVKDEEFFIKWLKLNIVFLGTNELPKLVLQEARIMEILLQNPHPNIFRYYGSLVERGRIIGFALDRHPRTLQQRLDQNTRSFDGEGCLGKIRSATQHLHSLGLAHNDLTPMNVVVDEDDSPFIIDYGSCGPVGETLITAGTPGWIDEEYTVSAQEHDLIALEKIQVWLDKISHRFHATE